MPKFKTKARTIDLLGKNQIADLPTAISELWKNGYDAYGDILDVNLYEEGYEDFKHTTFVLSDDGHGMSYNDIINKWIVLGTDSKKKKSITSSEDMFGKSKRISLGEKGIGRLSVAFIGNHMMLITKKEFDDYQILFMNWRIVENSDLFVDDIEIPVISVKNLDQLSDIYISLMKQYEININNGEWFNHEDLKGNIQSQLNQYSSISNKLKQNVIEHFNKNKHGTMFIIFDPISEIIDLIDEDPTNDNESSKHTRTSISGLFNPFDDDLMKKRKNDLPKDVASPSFFIHRRNELPRDIIKSNDFFSRDELDDCEHWIKGNFDSFGQFSGEVKVFNKVHKYYWKPHRSLSEMDYRGFKLELAFYEGDKSSSSMSAEEHSYYVKKTNQFGGLYIYRDGFRVLPYGREENDFLEFEKRRSLRASTYYFSIRRMFGYIGIGKETNPKLLDKAGREGLISNKAFKELKEDLKAFFIQVAREHYGTSESRRIEVEKNKEEYRQLKLIENEKKRNKKQLGQLRKNIKANKLLLKEMIGLLDDFDREIQVYASTGITTIELNNKLVEKRNHLEEKINQLKIVKPKKLAITDSDKDNLYDYNEVFQLIRSKFNKCDDDIIKNSDIYVLKTTYEDDFKRKIAEYRRLVTVSNGEMKLYLSNLESEYSKITKNNIELLKNYSPESIRIDNLTASDMEKMFSELGQVWTNAKDEMTEKYRPYIKYLDEMSFENPENELIGVLKQNQLESESKLQSMHELAQLGMAIEIIDHQFNVLYDQISFSLGELTRSSREIANDSRFGLLKSSFQHLEKNHKMLVPLYRTMRRSKKIITGKDIIEVINSFFGKQFNDQNIKFGYSEIFEEYEFYNFESIINPVFINIVNNAVYWLKSKEEKIIFIDVNAKNEVLIMNSGEKMKYTELENCFKLFFSKRPNGRGIGLYLAQTNLRSVGLDIFASNDIDYNKMDGACFVIKEFNKEE